MIPFRVTVVIGDRGQLSFGDTTLLHQWLDRHAGKTIDVVFKHHSKPKTQAQLGYLFAHVIPQVSKHIGYTEEEVYDILKYKFLRVDIGTEKEHVQGLSETDADSKLVSEFIDRCVNWGTQLGCEIYPPEHFGGTP